jgi:outer membrane protein assembly factor BamA
MRGTDYLKLYFEARNSSLLSTRGLSNISALPDYADIGTSLYGLEANITRLDYRFNPRKGYRLISRVSAGSRKIRKNVAVNPLVYEGLRLNSIQVNAMLDADLFVPLFRRATFNTGLMASWLESPSLFENELPRIGGINSLRGFNEESIFAASYAILNLEYRYLMDENAFIFVFVNGAWYENKAVNRNISDTPYGLGAGISFETKAGIFSLSYALGSEKGNPVQFRSAKVHFGLTSLF